MARRGWRRSDRIALGKAAIGPRFGRAKVHARREAPDAPVFRDLTQDGDLRVFPPYSPWIRQRARHRRARVTPHFLVADDGEVPHAQVVVLFIDTEH
jgi:hypothetical protein